MFVIYVEALKSLLARIFIYFLQKEQIIALKENEASTKVHIKYSDFLNFFLGKKVLILPEQIQLNKYLIKLENDK